MRGEIKIHKTQTLCNRVGHKVQKVLVKREKV